MLQKRPALVQSLVHHAHSEILGLTSGSLILTGLYMYVWGGLRMVATMLPYVQYCTLVVGSQPGRPYPACTNIQKSWPHLPTAASSRNQDT